MLTTNLSLIFRYQIISLCVVFMCCLTGLCSSCDVSSTSVQVMETVGQDLDAEDAGKLTEADKAQTGRVGH